MGYYKIARTHAKINIKQLANILHRASSKNKPEREKFRTLLQRESTFEQKSDF